MLIGILGVITILIQGILFGGILSILAISLTLIFGVSRVMNLAHGDFLVLGGMIATVLFVSYSVNPLFSLLLIVPLFAAIGICLGWLMRKQISSSNAELALISSLLITLGISNFIEGLGSSIAPAYGFVFFSIASLGSETINFYGLSVSLIFLISLVAVIALSIAMSIVVYKTSLGILIRGCTQDSELALMLGANINRIVLITFGVGISLAGLSGVIEVLVTAVDPTIGLSLTVSALTVVVLGGLGSFYGALAGGFITGFTTGVVELIIEEMGYSGAAWAPAVPLVMLILILIVRPQGLLRR